MSIAHRKPVRGLEPPGLEPLEREAAGERGERCSWCYRVRRSGQLAEDGSPIPGRLFRYRRGRDQDAHLFCSAACFRAFHGGEHFGGSRG